MNWEAISAVGEILGAIGVIVTLIFVAVQIRANTIATKAATYQDSLGYDLGNLRALGASPETATVFWTYVDNPDSLEGGELLQGRTLFQASIRHMENLFIQHEMGMLSDEAWASREPLILTFVRSPGFERLTSGRNRGFWAASFLDYAERFPTSPKATVGPTLTVNECPYWPIADIRNGKTVA